MKFPRTTACRPSEETPDRFGPTGLLLAFRKVCVSAASRIHQTHQSDGGAQLPAVSRELVSARRRSNVPESHQTVRGSYCKEPRQHLVCKGSMIEAFYCCPRLNPGVYVENASQRPALLPACQGL